MIELQFPIITYLVYTTLYMEKTQNNSTKYIYIYTFQIYTYM